MPASPTRRLVAIGSLAASVVAAERARGAVGANGNIIATLGTFGPFTVLLAGLEAANLTALLRNGGPFALFAPTDAAFGALPPASSEALRGPANAMRMQHLLLYHLVNASVASSVIAGGVGHRPPPHRARRSVIASQPVPHPGQPTPACSPTAVARQRRVYCDRQGPQPASGRAGQLEAKVGGPYRSADLFRARESPTP